MPTLLPPPMPLTPRDAPPPVFSPTPRAPSARNAPTPVFIPRPPLISPEIFPENFNVFQSDLFMIIQGIHNDRPIAVPVDEDGRLLVNTKSVSSAQKIPIVIGSPVVIDGEGYSIHYPLTIFIHPGDNGTITIEQRGSADGEFHLIQLPLKTPGIFSSRDAIKLNGGIEALRFTALLENGIVEIVP